MMEVEHCPAAPRVQVFAALRALSRSVRSVVQLGPASGPAPVLDVPVLVLDVPDPVLVLDPPGPASGPPSAEAPIAQSYAHPARSAVNVSAGRGRTRSEA